MKFAESKRQNDHPKQSKHFIDRATEAAMQSSRRGFFGWVGKMGIALLGGAAALEASPVSAATSTKTTLTNPDVGCPECWGGCNACGSSCTACNTACICNGGNCTSSIGMAVVPDAQTFRAHLLWILGYIPNCTCPNC